jgi:hypothetical protein
MTVTTPTYQVRATGRWLIKDYRIAAPDTPGNPGDASSFSSRPNLITRWKGRAFQQSPDSKVSLVGFEDEQVNWEVNAALLGWKAGPVRAIREVWGADSGTNVTKTEFYYRDAHRYQYHVRVHPIPPDGLYAAWDHRLGAVTTYYNALRPGGVAIDGRNKNVGHIDRVPVSGAPAFFDFCDPTFTVCSAFHNPEEVAGPNGGIVYNFDLDAGTTALHPAIQPYFRDDACLDDGTGDGPAPRPWPKERTTDPRVQAGYVAYWKAHGAPASLTYADLGCTTNPADPPWKAYGFQAAIGQHGIHFFVLGDSDNATLGTPATELVGSEWAYSVPMDSPTNVTTAYGANVNVPLQVLVRAGR